MSICPLNRWSLPITSPISLDHSPEKPPAQNPKVAAKARMVTMWVAKPHKSNTDIAEPRVENRMVRRREKCSDDQLRDNKPSADETIIEHDWIGLLCWLVKC